jgi:hypothetical protein
MFDSFLTPPRFVVKPPHFHMERPGEGE